MNTSRFCSIALIALVPGLLASCSTSLEKSRDAAARTSARKDAAQTPGWSRDDMNFFLHGSMSTEVAPERVLQAFIATYPELFPAKDLSNFGLIPDPSVGVPIGVSRKEVPHLGGMRSLGVNCAACHVGEIAPASGGAPVRVLGMTSHFDAEQFFTAVTIAGFRTADPANMKNFLPHYLDACDPTGGARARELLSAQLHKQDQKITAAIAADPTASQGAGADSLHALTAADLRLDKQLLERGADLTPLVRSLLKLFHNMRASLHIPDQPPEKAPPASGPGRNDAFGLLSLVLFGQPQPYAPVKYGLVWNVDERRWVHWDGNTQSPIGRNLLASLGLGAPLIGKRGQLDFALVQRQTQLSQKIRPPRYPFSIDHEAARRGAAHYQAQCARCHDGPEGDGRLHAVEEIGTELNRARGFNPHQADLFNGFLTSLEIPVYRPSKEPGIRSTQKYWAATLAGVWARSPYLHNGSVRTMRELLTLPSARAKTFRRGSRIYDATQMGYADDGAYVLDTTQPGNSNAGHDFGTALSEAQKRELIEHLKTL